ncbi:MAG: Crp/Fnr family transcriptional regulator [Hyphomicrobiales bacterium]|nr:Crp/Fnr family transcriptional regulator [Hyphomicrobiales bacterium]
MSVDTSWIARFEGLAGLAPADHARLLAQARVMELPPGAVLFTPGAPCGVYLLVLDGSVRVQMIADTGREIVLYRVRRGESCVLTTACLLGEEAYSAEGVVEEPTVGVAVPAPVFDELIARSDAFRRFVFAGYGRRVADILATMQAAVFHRIDARLARHLAARAERSIEVTHQDLAVELGTAREVVSRCLKAFEKRGLVRLGRGSVVVVDRPALQRLGETID